MVELHRSPLWGGFVAGQAYPHDHAAKQADMLTQCLFDLLRNRDSISKISSIRRGWPNLPNEFAIMKNVTPQIFHELASDHIHDELA
jgi:hypothetical protein